MLQQAQSLYREGRLERVVELCGELLDQQTDVPEALILVGASLHALQRYPEAIGVFSRLARLQPHIAVHWSNLGTSLRSDGRLDDALKAYRQAEALGFRSPQFYLNLGLLLVERGEHLEALPVLQWGAAIAPHDAELRYHYAHCCHECVRDDSARQALTGWQAWPDLDAPILAQIGSLLILLGETHQAEQAFERALSRDPRSSRVRLEYAALLERVNRLEEAQAMLDAVDPVSEADAELQEKRLVVAARLAERSGNLEEACDGYRQYADALQANRKHHALFPLAKALDSRGLVDEAFETLQDAHAAQMHHVAQIAPQIAGDHYEPLRITRYGCNAKDFMSWQDRGGAAFDQSPIFVVAFPRSGTTLLEQALDAHPALVSMDEQTFVQDAIDDIRSLGVTYPEQMGSLSELQCESLRQKYWQRVATRVHVPAGSRLIDKNPLNLLRLPVIRRLFPQSKIILAIRHPCDVILSNYMQHFRAPEIAALCQNIRVLAAGYRKSFDFWYQQADLLRPFVMELRYEDVVMDFEASMRSLSDFLKIDWADAMAAPAQHALRRGYISTPSYSQVIQPVNRKAVGRWRRYGEQFQPILGEVAPYLKRWKYEE